MNWMLWSLIAYMALDLLYTIAKTGDHIKVTPSVSAATVITHAAWIVFLVILVLRIS